MLIALFIAAMFAQQPAETPSPEPVVIKAGLGSCAADFMVKDPAGNPAYAATIHVRVRYGVMSVKRMDLEVSTGSDGKARVEGLPAKAKPLTYAIEKAGAKATAEQNVVKDCQAKYDVSLK
jgi:hypothetical protein